ncbi:MAG: hypothetical protein HOV80_16820 [Polyangiaceae bacterium]|nr:hypothetical protein [Polyangiaceae bacterium]
MVPETLPTAEGELAQTPFAHLAVFAVERRLTGELFLTEPGDVVHAIRFERGTPVKIRAGDDFARLGDLLVEGEIVPRDVVEGAAAMKGGLLGDLLVLSGYVEGAAIEAALAKQFQLRMTRFYGLAPQTTYKYFEGSQVLRDYGGDPASFDALDLVWQGIREHGTKSTLFQPTLDLLGDAPLKLHPAGQLDRLDLCEESALVVELLGLEPTPLAALLTEVDGASPELVKSFIYMMMLTRLLDLGKGLPVGVDERTRSVAKMKLSSQVHRAGAAVDAPGDGERSVRVKGRGIIPRDDGEPPPSTPRRAAAAAAARRSDAGLDASEAPESAKAPSSSKPAIAVPAGAAETVASESARDIVDEPSGGEESSRRLIADAVRGLTHEALLKLAKEKIDEKDPTTAAEICALGLNRLSEDGKADSAEARALTLVHVQARSLEPHPELKTLAVELDDLIRQSDNVALARFLRGKIRKKLGNDPGAISDFRRVLELDPQNAEAKNELATLEEGAKGGARRGETGFLKRLFRR